MPNCDLLKILFHTTPGTDPMYQIGIARVMIDDHQMTLKQANLDDLSQATPWPVNHWPPGYSIMIAAFLLITNSIASSITLLNLLGMVLFFIAWFLIIEMLGNSLHILARLAIWLFWMVAFSPVSVFAWSDVQALSFFSLNIAVCFCAIRFPRFSAIFGVVSGIFMGWSVALRYSYWPLCILRPIF